MTDSTESYVQTQRTGRVLEITMSRPPVNAINRAFSRELYRTFLDFQNDPELSCAVITGIGEKIFSAGWDLKEVAEGGMDPTVDNDPVKGFGPGGFAGITEFWDLQNPVIAAVNGAAIGGGFEVVLSCDMIVMSENGWFSLPEMQRGFLADAGATQKLPRLIPMNVAKELLLTGRPMDAEEALKWGLVNRVVPADQLREAALELAAETAKGAPLALQGFKEVMVYIDGMSTPEAMRRIKPGGDNELDIYNRITDSEDALEGPRAFAEKREPVWKGR
jgi:crotonobetainyl-CoA hydratase